MKNTCVSCVLVISAIMLPSSTVCAHSMCRITIWYDLGLGYFLWGKHWCILMLACSEYCNVNNIYVGILCCYVGVL